TDVVAHAISVEIGNPFLIWCLLFNPKCGDLRFNKLTFLRGMPVAQGAHLVHSVAIDIHGCSDDMLHEGSGLAFIQTGLVVVCPVDDHWLRGVARCAVEGWRDVFFIMLSEVRVVPIYGCVGVGREPSITVVS